MNDRSRWTELDTAAAVEALASDVERGVDAAEASRRLASDGPNELPRAKRRPWWMLVLDQFRSVLIVILLIAAGLSIALGENVEALAIALIVGFAAVLGLLQEVRAGRALEALEHMTAPEARVVRGGTEVTLPARELVRGDLVVIHAGDRIPADGRLVEAFNLQTDEAPLTGESAASGKDTAPAPGSRAIADSHNMVYAGTTAVSGRGKALVTDTGAGTEFGRIAGMIESVEKAPTPLEINIDRVGKALARVALVVVAAVAFAGILRGEPVLDMFVFGIALAVAVVPEALPAVVTISLAIGVQRMARRRALVRRLQAVETLGSVSVICADKTGTLTRDEMTVRRIYTSGRRIHVTGSGYAPEGEFIEGDAGDSHRADIEPPDIEQLLRAAVLASDAHVVNDRETGDLPASDWIVQGDPTEGALVTAAMKAGLDKAALDSRYRRVHEIPFSPEAKRMTTVHEDDGGLVAFSKGAPEVILDACTEILDDGQRHPLDDRKRNEVLEEARNMAHAALRVLALAMKPGAEVEDAGEGMVFLGLAGMMDPPREEAAAAIAECREAGIRPIMITGDHPTTAAAIARELGLASGDEAVTGSDLDEWSDAELADRITHASVFARVSPAHKLRIVEALQARGDFVAMTGDGVNDAPALRKADIGIAMGITGTAVTREAADMTLADDNFRTIVAAVEEGRSIYENIRKYLAFLLSANLGEIVLLATATLAGWPLPLSAVHILFVNLVTDGLPALALAVDPHEQNLMRRAPRDPRTGIFTPPIIKLIAAGGLWSGAANLALFGWALDAGYEVGRAMTLVLVSLVLTEFLKAYCFRSIRESALVRPFANRWLNRAIALDLLLLAAALYLPPFAALLGTEPLGSADWARAVGVAATIVPVLEIAKKIVGRENSTR